MTATAEDQLRLGMLALEHNYLTGEQLLTALRRWARAPGASLAELLTEAATTGETADRLREWLRARAEGTALEQGPSRTTPHLGPDAPPLPAPKDEQRYLFVREHARGGLGEVSVALDRELGREVALKEIQPRYADHPAARARFVREAELTGQLEHPGIVPVYGLGSYPNGRPWYAMRFIQGESLDAALARYHRERHPPLALRQLLTRFVAVCNAVAYAHSRGIVHRDLKPANIMLGHFGETLVVDWGLAGRVAESEPMPAQEQVIAPGALTIPGQAMGTPAYMAPEQARGEVERIGPAADVFALGATLYQLLTGRPPYSGEAVLQDAEKANWRPARQIHRAVPAALEAVCARAMAPQPEGRYASARELGDDVDRWLADEPVLAYCEPLLERARRWGRRHRTAVTAAVVFLLVSLLGLGGGLYAVSVQQEETRKERDQARVNEERAIQAEIQTAALLVKAEENLKLAKDAVNETFGIARDHRLLRQDRMREVRLLLFRRALPFYDKFQQLRPDDPVSREELAQHLLRVGAITAEIDDKQKARAAYERAAAAYRELIRQDATVSRRRHLAGALVNLGIVLKDQEEHREAIARQQEAHTIFSALLAESPSAEVRGDFAGALLNLANAHRQAGQREQAMRTYEQARDQFRVLTKAPGSEVRHHRGLGTTLANLGTVYNAAGKKTEALAAYREAEEIQTTLLAQLQGQAAIRDDLARTLNNLASLLHAQGEPDEANRAFARAEAIYRELVKNHPAVTAYRRSLASLAYNRGIALSKDDRATARASFRLAADEYERLLEANPTVPELRRGLGDAAYNLAVLLRAEKQPKEAITAFERARGAFAVLTKQAPSVSRHAIDLARTAGSLGYLYQQTGQPTEAIAAWGQEKDTLVQLIARHPTEVQYRRDQAIAALNRGILLADASKAKEALADLELVLTRVRELQKQANPPAELAGLAWRGHLARAHVLDQLGQHRDAVAGWEAAIKLAPPAQRAMPRLKLAVSLARAGLAPRAMREAEQLVRDTKGPPGLLVQLVNVAALSAAAIAQDKDVPREKREQLAEAYARRAMTWLEAGRKAGYFTRAANVARLKKDPDLTYLRERDDFKKFMKSLE